MCSKDSVKSGNKAFGDLDLVDIHIADFFQIHLDAVTFSGIGQQRQNLIQLRSGRCHKSLQQS